MTAGRLEVTGAVVLAGGLSRRMGGGDKGARLLGDRTILDRVVIRLRRQAPAVAVNANGDPARFPWPDVDVLPDSTPGNAGPLAGVLAAMEWAAAQECAVDGAARAVVTAPCDTPFLPSDLIARLAETARAASWNNGMPPIVVAGSAGRLHPVVALWPIALRGELRDALAGGMRRVGAFVDSHATEATAFGCGGIDPFFNINTPEDLEVARRFLEAEG